MNPDGLVCIQSRPLSSVTLGKIHNPSMPQFPYLKNDDNISTHTESNAGHMTGAVQGFVIVIGNNSH